MWSPFFFWSLLFFYLYILTGRIENNPNSLFCNVIIFINFIVSYCLPTQKKKDLVNTSWKQNNPLHLSWVCIVVTWRMARTLHTMKQRINVSFIPLSSHPASIEKRYWKKRKKSKLKFWLDLCSWKIFRDFVISQENNVTIVNPLNSYFFKKNFFILVGGK